MNALLKVLAAIILVACQGQGFVEPPPPAPLHEQVGHDSDGLMAAYGWRWERATGISLDEYGFKVYLVAADEPFACGGVPSGMGFTGCAYHEAGVAVVRAGLDSATTEAVVVHELGHLLAGRPGHVHTGGIMGDNLDHMGTHLDMGALELACEGVDCAHMHPESE